MNIKQDFPAYGVWTIQRKLREKTWKHIWFIRARITFHFSIQLSFQEPVNQPNPKSWNWIQNSSNLNTKFKIQIPPNPHGKFLKLTRGFSTPQKHTHTYKYLIYFLPLPHPTTNEELFNSCRNFSGMNYELWTKI